jgi:hypothetical protein
LQYDTERRNIALKFQSDSNAKKNQSEQMRFNKFNEQESQQYNKVSLTQEGWNKLGDDLYNFIYQNLSKEKNFFT